MVKLILMLVLLVALADAVTSYDSVGLDVVGSEADGADIISSGAGPVEVDIVGGTATNIRIGPLEEADNCTECSACYCGECSCGYTTIWDDFTRPLCYPWSSYIPTRYNKPFHLRNSYQGITPAGYDYNGYPVSYLGRYYQSFK